MPEERPMTESLLCRWKIQEQILHSVMIWYPPLPRLINASWIQHLLDPTPSRSSTPHRSAPTTGRETRLITHADKIVLTFTQGRHGNVSAPPVTPPTTTTTATRTSCRPPPPTAATLLSCWRTIGEEKAAAICGILQWPLESCCPTTYPSTPHHRPGGDV